MEEGICGCSVKLIIMIFVISSVFRCTMNKIPETKELLNKSRLPLGVLIHPFRDINVRKREKEWKGDFNGSESDEPGTDEKWNKGF